jgi:uncharacterized membrane protein
MIAPTPMLRDADGFTLRGISVGRIEAFSDVVFGFALTLIVVSVEVPKSFELLRLTLRGFLPFAICFSLLFSVWHAHYQYFRRFATHDAVTIRINAALLFVVMFYVYPLKFLFTLATLGGQMTMEPREVTYLLVLFGLGFAAIQCLLAALYWNALRQRVPLDLSPVEVELAHGYMFCGLGIAAIGLLSALVAMLLPGRDAGYAGLVYMLLSLWIPLFRRYSRRKAPALAGVPAVAP